MKKLFLVLITLMIVGIFIPVVSAEEHIISDYPYTNTMSATGAVIFEKSFGGASIGAESCKMSIALKNVENYPEINYLFFEQERSSDNGPFLDSIPVGSFIGTYTRPSDDTIQPIHISVSRYYNIFGQHYKTVIIGYPQNWEIGSKTGFYSSIISFDNKTYTLPRVTGTSNPRGSPIDFSDHSAGGIVFTNGYQVFGAPSASGFVGCVGYKEARATIEITEHIENTDYININLIRVFDKAYDSTVEVYDKSGALITKNQGVNNAFVGDFRRDVISNITVYSNLLDDFYHVYVLRGDIDIPVIPDTDTVTVYVKNSQNGALIANSHIVISANVNGEFHEVVNETLPGGIYTGNLQPTGGGLPNPDYYRLVATAEGYNSIMPYIDFEHGSDTTIYAILDPIGGAPEDENNTFIDFYVRDINANPIAGATVKFGGYTLYTNNAGYTIFEVEKDNTYTWSVSKLGYGSVTGNAVIGSNARYTVNAVIAPEVTPTTPTPIPSVTPIKPTPTLTAPTGEPVSNWLEWFAAHFGMILGGGVEIGKIFMWLCFTVPVGVFVGNKARAGAAGFMAGAGIVTLFFVLIGWVPIWLVVLLALIIGLLYAKVYSNSDNGGGR